MKDAPRILTVGHSNRDLGEFLDLLRSHDVKLIADVRKLPGSRSYPHFNAESLSQSLREVEIGYQHFAGLGGRRSRAKNSPNGAWRNASFQAFADYMLTSEFETALKRLLEQPEQRIALMCAEAVPWRCHRSLIADALVVRGVAVEHIMSPGRRDPHSLREWAKVDGTTITYPPTEDPQGSLFEK